MAIELDNRPNVFAPGVSADDAFDLTSVSLPPAPDQVKEKAQELVEELLNEKASKISEMLSKDPKALQNPDSELLNNLIEPPIHTHSAAGISLQTAAEELLKTAVLPGLVLNADREEKRQKPLTAAEKAERAKEIMYQWRDVRTHEARQIRRDAAKDVMSTSPEQTKKRRESFRLGVKGRQKVYKKTG